MSSRFIMGCISCWSRVFVKSTFVMGCITCWSQMFVKSTFVVVCNDMDMLIFFSVSVGFFFSLFFLIDNLPVLRSQIIVSNHDDNVAKTLLYNFKKYVLVFWNQLKQRRHSDLVLHYKPLFMLLQLNYHYFRIYFCNWAKNWHK